tara:strand:+ start:719 stop:1450 length:732 start_codon:yes stop_codon:yes gene_type:complete
MPPIKFVVNSKDAAKDYIEALNNELKCLAALKDAEIEDLKKAIINLSMSINPPQKPIRCDASRILSNYRKEMDTMTEILKDTPLSKGYENDEGENRFYSIDDLEELAKDYVRVKEEYERLEADSDQVAKDYEKLNEENEMLEQTIHDLNMEIDELRNDFEDAEGKLFDTRKTLDDAEKNITELKDELKDAMLGYDAELYEATKGAKETERLRELAYEHKPPYPKGSFNTTEELEAYHKGNGKN